MQQEKWKNVVYRRKVTTTASLHRNKLQELTNLCSPDSFCQRFFFCTGTFYNFNCTSVMKTEKSVRKRKAYSTKLMNERNSKPKFNREGLAMKTVKAPSQ